MPTFFTDKKSNARMMDVDAVPPDQKEAYVASAKNIEDMHRRPLFSDVITIDTDSGNSLAEEGPDFDALMAEFQAKFTQMNQTWQEQTKALQANFEKTLKQIEKDTKLEKERIRRELTFKAMKSNQGKKFEGPGDSPNKSILPGSPNKAILGGPTGQGKVLLGL